MELGEEYTCAITQKIYMLKSAESTGRHPCDKCAFDYDHLHEACHQAPCQDTVSGYFVEKPVQSVVPELTPSAVPAKFKSDGGSSDYYKLTIKRASDGQVFACEMGDIIYSVFGGDFDLGNIVKACRRMHLDGQGGGKDGIDAEYDAKKIEWFTKDFLQRVNKGD